MILKDTSGLDFYELFEIWSVFDENKMVIDEISQLLFQYKFLLLRKY